MARVGKTPGKTQSINFFTVQGASEIRNSEKDSSKDSTVAIQVVEKKLFTGFFVDLPGYGFANVSKSTQKNWSSLMATYFETRKNLRLINLLMDVRREPKKEEFWVIENARRNDIHVQVILTKVDKLSSNEFFNRRKVLSSIFECVDMLPVSTAKEDKYKRTITELRELCLSALAE